MYLNLLQMPNLGTPSSETFWTIFGIVIGVFLSGMFQFFTVNLKIKADRKRHREDRWWNFKFDLFNEIDAITSDAIILAGPEVEEILKSEYIEKMLLLGIRCSKIFKDKSIGQSILDLDNEMSNKNDPIKVGEIIGNAIKSSLKELGLK